MANAATMRSRRDGGDRTASPAPACESEPAAGDVARLAASELAINESCGRVSDRLPACGHISDVGNGQPPPDGLPTGFRPAVDALN